MFKMIVGVLIGLVCIIGVFLVLDPNINGGTASPNNTSLVSSMDESKISVKILGAVVNPGTYTLKDDETLRDLIDKAGGLVSSADEDCFDEGVSLSGHDSFYIPFISGFSEECKASNVIKICINTGTVEELSQVNGITQTIAKNIVSYREEHGDFRCLEDIINVSGIGTKTFEKIKDYISLK